MNRILTLLCIGLLSGNLNAQSRDHFADNSLKEKMPTGSFTNKSANKASAWYKAADKIRQRGSFVEWIYPVHPDTTLNQFDINTNKVYDLEVSSVGEVLDPTSPFWEDHFMTSLSETQGYTLDSIQIPFYYIRVNKSVPDTLLIQLFTTSSMTYVTESASSVGKTYCTPTYNVAKKKGQGAAKEIKVVLDNSMASSGINFDYLYQKIDMNISAGEEVALKIHFIPGNPNNPNDTIARTYDGIKVYGSVNAFYVFELVDDRKDYYDGHYNFELNVYTPAGLKLFPNAWLDAYVPGVINPSPFHCSLGFKLTYDDFTGIENEANNKSVSFAPNPCHNVLKISGIQESTLFELFDLKGRKVVSTMLQIGQNNIELGNLPKGLYVSRINNQTEKIIVE